MRIWAVFSWNPNDSSEKHVQIMCDDGLLETLVICGKLTIGNVNYRMSSWAFQKGCDYERVKSGSYVAKALEKATERYAAKSKKVDQCLDNIKTSAKWSIVS